MRPNAVSARSLGSPLGSRFTLLAAAARRTAHTDGEPRAGGLSSTSAATLAFRTRLGAEHIGRIIAVGTASEAAKQGAWTPQAIFSSQTIQRLGVPEAWCRRAVATLARAIPEVKDPVSLLPALISTEYLSARAGPVLADATSGGRGFAAAEKRLRLTKIIDAASCTPSLVAAGEAVEGVLLATARFNSASADLPDGKAEKEASPQEKALASHAAAVMASLDLSSGLLVADPEQRRFFCRRALLALVGLVSREAGVKAGADVWRRLMLMSTAASPPREDLRHSRVSRVAPPSIATKAAAPPSPAGAAAAALEHEDDEAAVERVHFADIEDPDDDSNEEGEGGEEEEEEEKKRGLADKNGDHQAIPAAASAPPP